MSHKRTSIASIALAESKKSDGEANLSNDAEPRPTSHIFLKVSMAVLTLLLLGGGAYGAYYLYSKSPLATSRSTATTRPQSSHTSIVKADAYAVVVTDGLLPMNLLSRIQAEAAKTQKPGTIKEIVLGHKNPAGAAGSVIQVSALEAIDELDMNAPDILTRTLTSDWMLGVYNSPENEKGAFVIVTTNFFQNAFAGMLQWESVMADDLKLFLYPSAVAGIANTTAPQVTLSSSTIPGIALTASSTGTASSTRSATSTASATSTRTSTSTEFVQPLRSYFTLKGRFEDRIIKNKDVRAFRTDDGAILFLYSFVDNTHLALASDEATITEVLIRLEKQASIR